MAPLPLVCGLGGRPLHQPNRTQVKLLRMKNQHSKGKTMLGFPQRAYLFIIRVHCQKASSVRKGNLSSALLYPFQLEQFLRHCSYLQNIS